MNRHERRKAKKYRIALDQIHSTCDIQVDAKFEQVVGIFANAKGRKIVEDVWPDVQWTTDEKFQYEHPPDWLFTHVRVTKLPSHLETMVPLSFASPDSLGFAVAATLQRHAELGRVIYYSGAVPDVIINRFGGIPDGGTDAFAEYVPAGTPLGGPKSVH